MFYSQFGLPRQRCFPGQRTAGRIPPVSGGTGIDSRNVNIHSPNCCSPQHRESCLTDAAQHRENPIAEKEVCHKCPCAETNQQSLFLKKSFMGEIILPENTDKGASIRIASINVDTSGCGRFAVNLNFSCNIITSDASVNLEFQFFRQLMKQAVSVPVSSVMLYARGTRSTEANILSFSSVDEDALRSKCCNYSVYAKTTAYHTLGLTRLTDSVIICTFLAV